MEDVSLEITSSFQGSSTPPLPPSCTTSGGTFAIGAGGNRYIVHRVTMRDTLAGVAIKYGVEVADLKRINGLVTDRQMFAHKTLHIPLPGRHPPSPSPSQLSNDSEHDSIGLSNSEQTRFKSLKLTSSSSSPAQNLSSAMDSLQSYYNLKPSVSSLTHSRKSRSLANGLSNEKLFRRRQKSETDISNGCFYSNLGSSSSGFGGSVDSLNGFRKSSSVSSLQDDENGLFSSLWLGSKWNLKPDLQVFSGSVFDGLSNPIIGWKSKAALD